MSYVSTKPGYYDQFQIGTGLEEGTEGWTRAPWPGWGQNPALIGPSQIAVGASPDGLGAYLLAGFGPNPYAAPPAALGAYYAARANQAIGQTEPGKLLPVLLFGGLALAAVVVGAKMVGKQPAHRRNAGEPLKLSDKPRRVEMLVGSGSGGWFKPGQYGLVRGVDTRGGMYLVDKDRDSRPGEKALLIGKSAKSGALWFSEDAVRYTRQRRAR